MSKTRAVTIYPITCSKGHTFYPKVLPDGTVSSPDKCMIRSCRVYLDSNRVKKGLEKRKLNLRIKKQPVVPTITNYKKILEMPERPRCNICNLVFYDQQNLINHNKRLHQQSY